MRVIIGSDHGAVAEKAVLVEMMKDLGYEVADFGTHSKDAVDYPDIALLVCRTVTQDPANTVGIILDGVGAGSCMAANKIPGIRAAAAYDVFSAGNARRHNNANVLTLGSRVVGVELLKEIVKSFLSNEFEGGRHQRRVDKIMQLERRYSTERCG